MSVATRIFPVPFEKSEITFSRSNWSLSPCMDKTSNPASLSRFDTSSTLCFWAAKIKTLPSETSCLNSNSYCYERENDSTFIMLPKSHLNFSLSPETTKTCWETSTFAWKIAKLLTKHQLNFTSPTFPITIFRGSVRWSRHNLSIFRLKVAENKRAVEI